MAQNKLKIVQIFRGSMTPHLPSKSFTLLELYFIDIYDATKISLPPKIFSGGATELCLYVDVK